MYGLLGEILGMLQHFLRAEMQKYPQQLSLFSEDQHEVQKVQGAGNMMCSGNFWTKSVCLGAEMCYFLVSFQRFESSAHVQFRKDAFIFCRVYKSIVPWLKTLSSIPTGAAPSMPWVPLQDLKLKQQDQGLTTPMQPEHLGMNLMHISFSLHFPCWAWPEVDSAFLTASWVNELNHVIKHRVYAGIG